MSLHHNSGLPSQSSITIEDLLQNAQKVGGVFSTGYDECDILTNDKWTQDAGGLPKHSLLIARPLLEGEEIISDDEVHDGHRLPEEASKENDPTVSTSDSTHALLLRVIGPADTPDEGRLQTNRYDAIREAITGNENGNPSSDDFVDVLTRREMQFSGVKAKVLGTFYYEDSNNEDEKLVFGSDVQSFFSAGHYTVQKPSSEALEWMASYPTTRKDSPVKLGDVQYTTTNIWGEKPEAGMYFDVEEFIGAKTAVFGMTRKGKSNTMKILAGAIANHDESVGQLIFDPSGEYAYVNDQDECALGELHDTDGEISVVYKFAADENDDRYLPLRTNLLDRSNLHVVQDYVRQQLAGESADYIGRFLHTNIPTKDKINDLEGGEWRRAKRRHSAFFAVVSKAVGENHIPDDFDPIYLGVDTDVLEKINEYSSLNHEKNEHNSVPLGTYRGDNYLVDFWESVANNIREIESVYSGDNDWVDDDLENVLEMLQTSGSQSGWGKLAGLSSFHNPQRSTDVAEEIYQRLCDGDMVVVDISNGTENVVRSEKERIVNHILSESMKQFRKLDDDEELPKIQLFLEEAHQHFETETVRDDSMNPFVTLAKEGAKFQVGMAYATQEVTSVDRRVLSNTANWIVTHINSKKEINELSKYYNFEDFKKSIRNVEEVGFARAKTYQGEYIVPTKISLFDLDWVERNTTFGVKKDGEFLLNPDRNLDSNT